jgi:hypothetical protein
MVLRNTSRYPTDDVRALVEFATGEIDMNRVCVNVKNSRTRAYSGSAYFGVPEISNAPPDSEYLVTIRLGPPEMFPLVPERRRRAPSIEISCWREALVTVAAHEANHIDQYRRDLPRSEVACERFDAWVLGRYRAMRARAALRANANEQLSLFPVSP